MSVHMSKHLRFAGDPDLPYDSAAKEAIRIQFERIFSDLPKAIAGDVEAVHDVRVALRRADLPLILAFLRKRTEGALIDRSRNLRRKLGEVRTKDVLMESLGELEEPVFQALRVQVAIERAKLLKKVRRLAEEFWSSEDQTLALKWLRNEKSERSPLRKSSLDRTSDCYSHLMQTYEEYQTKSSLENVHAVRIAAKKTRYAAEFFGKCFDWDAAELIDRCVAVQESLGNYGDKAEISRLLRRALKAQGVWSCQDEVTLSSRLDALTAQMAEILKELPGKIAKLTDGPWHESLINVP